MYLSLFLVLFLSYTENIILILPKRYTVIYMFYLATERFINHYVDWKNV